MVVDSKHNKEDQNLLVLTAGSGCCGTFNLVNPPLEFYKNGTITFDLSDSSLSLY